MTTTAVRVSPASLPSRDHAVLARRHHGQQCLTRSTNVSSGRRFVDEVTHGGRRAAASGSTVTEE
jgi:hypothetical protein